VYFFSHFIQYRSELEVVTFRLTSGVHSLNLVGIEVHVYIVVYTGFVKYSGFFVVRTGTVFTEGQVLAGEFRLRYRGYTDTQT
jgi:hypothetical protein